MMDVENRGRGRARAMGILPALLALGVLCLRAGPVQAWWGGGHRIITRTALRAAPADLPSFFHRMESQLADESCRPDLFKNRSLPHLSPSERPEHYMDLELLRDGRIPSTRYAFYDTCAARGLDPERVGTVPYAVAEWTERLALTLAEYRRWPDSRSLQSECMTYAGILAHYAADLCQPLHTTVDHDGRHLRDGTVQFRGIHGYVDGLLERLALRPENLAEGLTVGRIDDLMDAIRTEIRASHGQVDRVYELAPGMKSGEGEAVRRFARERARAAAAFTASLWEYAWRCSSRVRLPEWYGGP